LIYQERWAKMFDMDWDIIGHAWAANMLQQHIAGGKMRHAYLFSGPTGVGRRTLALRFAQAVNCTQPPAPGYACGTCRTCQQIKRMQFTDLSVIQSEDEGSVLKVDQIRALQHDLSLAPYEGGFRVALLLRFEEANPSAQNAMLKTLEEPNPKVLLLLTADDPENLLPTITSRCEVLRLRSMPVDALVTILEKKEGLAKEKANLIAHISGGRVGYAKQLAEDDAVLERRGQWMENLLMLLAGNRSVRFLFSEKLNKGKKDRTEVKQTLWEGLGFWLSFWRDVMLVRTGSGVSIANIDLSEEVEKVSGYVTNQTSAEIVSRLEHSFARMQSANLQLMLDNLLLDWPIVK
jgi:DNA polymerase III subunit delta'